MATTYKVKITYNGPANPENIRFVSPICPVYCPCNSYVDTAAYKDTCYDTNVEGFGKIDVMEPYASTSFPFPVPLSQFKVAVIGQPVSADAPNGPKYVEFEVDSYMEAFWYTQAGIALADQGFVVEITPNTALKTASDSSKSNEDQGSKG